MDSPLVEAAGVAGVAVEAGRRATEKGKKNSSLTYNLEFKY